MAKQKIKKVDVYSADKNLVDRIGEFTVCHTQYINIKVRFESRLKGYKTVLEDKSRPDRVWIDEEQKVAAIKQAQEEYDACKAEYDALIEEHARFRYTLGDDKFYETYAKGGDVVQAFIDWCDFYHLTVEDSDLLANVLLAIGGKGKLTTKQHVRSVIDGEVKFNGSRKKRDVLDVMYGEIAEYYIDKGACPMPEFEQGVIDKYGKKAK